MVDYDYTRKTTYYQFSFREKGEDEIHSDEEFDNDETIQRFVMQRSYATRVLCSPMFCLLVGNTKYVQ